jgi:hypothetical protein
VACGNGTITATNLTIGSTYYIRVYTDPNIDGAFNICITDPAPANNLCANAITLTSGTTCVNTAGNMQAATFSAITVATPNCETGTVVYDVWYEFVAQTTNPTITLSNIGAGFAPDARMQLLTNDCSAPTALFCGTTSIAADYLEIGTTYLIRVYSVSGTAPANGFGMNFNICVTDPVTPPPFNDDCANAINLGISAACENLRSTMAGATLSSAPLGTCTGPVTYDVWYKFTAITATSAIQITTETNNFTNRRFQVLTGTCGSLTSLACGVAGTELSVPTTVGAVYYVRIYSTTAGAAPNGNAEFNVCVRGVGAPIRFGNSYVNISKKTTGGVVQTGDTLEIRMTINHKTGTLFNARYVDNIPAGTEILTGPTDRIRIITNEGLPYKEYTLAASDDAATYRPSPLAAGQHNIRLNLALGSFASGTPAAGNTTEAASAIGQVLSTHNPRGGGGVLFAIAYRVRVTAAVGSTITLYPGQFIYRATSGGPDITLTATPFQILVTNPQTLCSNSVGLNNAVEEGGTFGSGTTLTRSTDLANPIAGYSFMPSISRDNVREVNDGRYAVVKNISPRETTLRAARMRPNCDLPSPVSTYDPASCTNRMFNGHWAVDGDHTGTNTSVGNLPPAKGANSGYMLLVNADFVASEAYRQTISNLCPNTYYEFSAWFRNVCANCGADSLARQFNTLMPDDIENGYPGVLPNLSFAVDGIDQYSTGEIDAASGWVKRGFVILTGPTQTSATFTIRNNSQGGGGNDWAMDDISVSTCLPTMRYSPSTVATACFGSPYTIRDTVRSAFNTYTNYKWQRSTNGGTAWTDVSSTATATPTLEQGEYQFVTSYTIPPTETTVINDNDLYRVIVATTSTNLNATGCVYTDTAGRIPLRTIDCGPVLDVNLLSFTGKKERGGVTLQWSTTKENTAVQFEVERSSDGSNFHRIGIVNGYNNPGASTNEYNFHDSLSFIGKVLYRVTLFSGNPRRVQSHTITLQNEGEAFELSNLVNPINETLSFNLTMSTSAKVTVSLLDGTGHTVKQKDIATYAGVNQLRLPEIADLASGIYILQVRHNDKVIIRKVVKR